MQKRRIFIGDVHGCYDELMALLEKVSLTDHDELYFVGDLINKGPKSLEVVEFVRHRPNTYSVLGNHEYFSFPDQGMIDEIDSGESTLSEGNKNWVRLQFEKSKPLEEILQKNGNLDWIKSLPHIIEQEDFIVIHGGLHPEHGLETPIEYATLIRGYEGRPWYEYYSGKKPVIYGHWAVDGLRIRHNTIGLDTGCCFGGSLTAYCLDTGAVWQVRANQVYINPGHWGMSED